MAFEMRFNSIGEFQTRALILYPPACEECRRRNPDALTTQPPSRLYVHHNSRAQAHFELIGAAPFKSNSFTAIDFDTVGSKKFFNPCEMPEGVIFLLV
jgi:hypothetical protein